jgi:hypothetical protein
MVLIPTIKTQSLTQLGKGHVTGRSVRHRGAGGARCILLQLCMCDMHVNVCVSVQYMYIHINVCVRENRERLTQ